MAISITPALKWVEFLKRSSDNTASEAKRTAHESLMRMSLRELYGSRRHFNGDRVVAARLKFMASCFMLAALPVLLLRSRRCYSSQHANATG
jgi:hypothetical protein